MSPVGVQIVSLNESDSERVIEFVVVRSEFDSTGEGGCSVIPLAGTCVQTA